jgi:hypothetical protein
VANLRYLVFQQQLMMVQQRIYLDAEYPDKKRNNHIIEKNILLKTYSYTFACH